MANTKEDHEKKKPQLLRKGGPATGVKKPMSKGKDKKPKKFM